MKSWHRFIDDREEFFARRDEEFKDAGTFRLGMFDVTTGQTFKSVAQFNAAIAETMKNADAFYGPMTAPDRFSHEANHIVFPSPLGGPDQQCTATAPAPPKSRRMAIVIVPHWNSQPDAYDTLASAFTKIDVWPVVMTLPHHNQRSSDGIPVANGFLNADIGNTIVSVRQSVCEVRSLVNWLKAEGFEKVAVLGASLGSSVASLAAAFEPQIDRTILLLTAGDFAEVVWKGRATRHIRQQLEGHVSLDELKRAWSIISPIHFMDNFLRNGSRLLIISASRDQVVPLPVAREFVEKLRRSGVPVKWSTAPCGHYTLSMQPFGSFLFLKSAIFLKAK